MKHSYQQHHNYHNNNSNHQSNHNHHFNSNNNSTHYHQQHNQQPYYNHHQQQPHFNSSSSTTSISSNYNYSKNYNNSSILTSKSNHYQQQQQQNNDNYYSNNYHYYNNGHYQHHSQYNSIDKNTSNNKYIQNKSNNNNNDQTLATSPSLSASMSKTSIASTITSPSASNLASTSSTTCSITKPNFHSSHHKSGDNTSTSPTSIIPPNTSLSSSSSYSYKIVNHLSTVNESDVITEITPTELLSVNSTYISNDALSSSNIITNEADVSSNNSCNTNDTYINNRNTSYHSNANEIMNNGLNKREYYRRLILEMDRLHPTIKWPLHTTWSFWYIKNDRLKKDWKDNLIKLIDVSYIEDFWSIFNHLVTPSGLETGADLALFKAGVVPMWEDPENKTGGRWLVTFNAQSRKANELDEIWLNSILALIGDNLCGEHETVNGIATSISNGVSCEDHICNNITGICVQNRPKIDKLSLWTKDYKNESLMRLIGRKWKQTVDMKHALTFEPHDNQYSKNSSSKLVYKE